MTLVTKALKSNNESNSNLGNTFFKKDNNWGEQLANSFIQFLLNLLIQRENSNSEQDLILLERGKNYVIKFFNHLVATNLELLKEGLNVTDNAITVDWNKVPLKALYEYWCKYLWDIQTTREDFLINKKMFSDHHINPKFEGGDNSAANRILLHKHEHGFLHL